MPPQNMPPDNAFDPWDWDDLDPSPDIKHEGHPRVLRQWVKAYRRECFELRATLDLVRGDIIRALNGKGTLDRGMLNTLLYPDEEKVEELAAWQRKRAKSVRT